MKDNSHFFELGRSMVEMLAVLAILALLTVGGVVFYKMSIVKHSAVGVYGQTGLAYAQMIIKKSPVVQQPPDATISAVDVGSSLKEAFLKVELENPDVCKEVARMYEGNPDFQVVAKSDEEEE